MPGELRFEDDDDADEEPISLGLPGAYPEAEPQNLGPDERDRDLMDGSWEQRYYAGRQRRRDWSGIMAGLGLLVLLGLLLPAVLVFFR